MPQSMRSTIGRKTIDLFSTTSLEAQESYLTTGMYLTNTRDFFRQHSTFAWLYNAAASSASRLRSAASLAIICATGVFCLSFLKPKFDLYLA